MPSVVTVKARENPLATHKLEGLTYEFQNDDWQSFYKRLKKMRFTGALMGKEGSGKTTLLLEIAQKLKEEGFEPMLIKLSGGKRNLPMGFWFKLISKNIILLDGAENLPLPIFWLFKLKCRWALGLIITAHKEGLLPTILKCQTSPELLFDLITSLLGHPLEKAQVADLYKQSAGNIRLALLHLYSNI